MIEHIWTVICSGVIIDQDTNNISIYNILEELTLPEEAVKNQVIGVAVELVTLWVRADLSKPAKGTSRVSLIAPDGEVAQLAEAEIDLSQFERLRNRGLFQGIPYKGDGVYRFVMEYKATNEEDWKKVASVPLKVKILYHEEQTDKKKVANRAS